MTKQHLRLMIPGPVEAEDDVLAAMAEQTLPHYGPQWLAVYRRVVDDLKQLFGTRHDLFIIPGAGSAGLDAAFGSLLRTGEGVLIASNGFFGDRIAAMARGYGLDVHLLRAPLDRPLDPDSVRRGLASEPRIRAVAVVHLETSTGVLNPVGDIAAVAREFGVPIVVDAVSSLGGVPLPVDEWGIDVCVSVANKCLACPPGVALVSVSPRAWEQIDRHPDRAHGWYLNLSVWKDYADRWASWHPYPTTLPTNNVVALGVGLRRILDQGLAAYHARFDQVARHVRSGLRRFGFDWFTAEAYTSPLLTAVRGLPGMDVEALRQYLLDEWQVLVSGGLEELHGQIYRVGHIGKACSREYADRFLAGVEAFLSRP